MKQSRKRAKGWVALGIMSTQVGVILEDFRVTCVVSQIVSRKEMLLKMKCFEICMRRRRKSRGSCGFSNSNGNGSIKSWNLCWSCMQFSVLNGKGLLNSWLKHGNGCEKVLLLVQNMCGFCVDVSLCLYPPDPRGWCVWGDTCNRWREWRCGSHACGTFLIGREQSDARHGIGLSKVECLAVSAGRMVLGSKWKFCSETGVMVAALLEAMMLLRVKKVLMRIINMLFGNTVMTVMSWVM